MTTSGVFHCRWRTRPRYAALATVFFLGIPRLAWPVQVPGPEVRVTARVDVENEPDLAIWGDHAVAVWYWNLFPERSGWGYSTDGGNTWIDGGAFAPLSTTGHRVRGQASVCVDGAGRFYAVTGYTMTPNSFALSVFAGSFSETGISWSAPVFAVPIIPFTSPLAYDSPQLACDSESGIVYLTYSRAIDVDPDPAEREFEYTVHLVRSSDGGATWSTPVPLSGPASNGARPIVGPDGELYVIWEDFAVRQVVGRKSTDFGASFGNEFIVADVFDNLASGPPDYMSSYDRSTPPYAYSTLVPNFPSVDIDRSSGPRRGSLYVTWAEYAAGTPSSVSRYIYESEPNGYFASATPVAIGDEISGAADWPEDPRSFDYFRFEATAGTTLWLDRQGYNGGTWMYVFCGADTSDLVTVGDISIKPWTDGPMPPWIFTVPADDTYYLFIGPGSFYYNVTYRLRLLPWTPDPNAVARDHRDIVLVSSSDGGLTWSGKVRVNDDPPRYDNSFPEVAVDGSGRVHVAWYDRRDDPGCGEFANTYWAYSDDGGASFAPSERLSTQSSSWDFRNLDGSNIGDHLALEGGGDRVIALWTDKRGATADIYSRTILTDEPTGITVAGFRAEAGPGSVTLSWSLADQPWITGFRVHRSEGDGDRFIALEDARIDTDANGQSTVTDRTVVPGRSYGYRLEIIQRDGASAWSDIAHVSVPALEGRLRWGALDLNPADRPVSFEVVVPRAGMLSVRVVDVSGRQVIELAEESVAAGSFSFRWDGRDASGRTAAAGVYLAVASFGAEKITRRIVKLP